ncbi:MAG TPA: VWA domain-containing protein [Baekduia sp.]|uniref:VWA domain-containing protein n=1 Tax=Baekduia sp. TaxID=2600305 RepID=UPI002CDDA977|nr:VWA domain-containing protein [Baekduia sp.]HMJ34711.1 VWA domain-containing protein [Baekduia sp.]
MSFGAPLILLALLIVPALAAWYVALQRNRVRAAAAFAAPTMAPSIAPRRPRWRRHVPLLAFVLAIAVLVVAAARPQRTVAVPVEHAQIMLLTDVSGSMLATDVAPSRLVAARRAAQKFVDGVPKQVNVGVMAFNQVPQVLQSPTQDRDDLALALGRLKSSGGTATGEAIQTAVRVLQGAPSVNGRKPPSAIVLLSDGVSTKGVRPEDAAAAAKRLKIPIYTVALGTPGGTITVPRTDGGTGTITRRVPPDEASLRAVAQASGGRAYTAASAKDLSTVYQRLGSQLGRKKEPREITAGFAGAGLALLALGAALSLRWFGRLI